MSEARLERAALRVAIAASVVFALVCFWELFGPLPGGHLGNAAGAAMAGENMVRWRLFGAVLAYTAERPGPAELYTHHPYGVFLTSALAYEVFGHGWWTVRLPAALMSALSAPLMFVLARALWGVVPAAVATVAFVVIPIDLAYATFQNLEVVTIFFSLLFSWGTVRLWQSWQTAYLVPSAVGALGACQGDWVGLVLVGVVGVFAFVRAYVLPRRLFDRVDDRQHARWFGWTTAGAVFTLVLYLVLFAKAGKLADLLGSYEARSAGSAAPLGAIFGPRRMMWLFWMIPPLALSAIALGAPITLYRLFRRRAEEIVPLAWLAAASVQYFGFRQGADVHVFWPHYYGPVAALSFAAIVALGGRLSRRFGLSIALVPVTIALALVARIGFAELVQSRLTGGRFDDGGRYIAVDQDRNAFAAWAARDLPPSVPVALHPSFLHNWHVDYAVRRPVQIASELGPRPDGPSVLLVDARYVSGAELVKLSARAPDIVGPFWRIDRARGEGPPTALRYEEREPRLWERYFVTGTDLVRHIGPGVDALATWAWREHLGVASPPPPDAIATSIDEACLAHGAALARGDDAAAARHRAAIDHALEHPIGAAFTGDLRLLGATVREGAATVVTLVWETGPAFRPVDADFLVRSTVIAPPRLWLTKIDYFEKEMAPPNALRMSLWRPSRIYAQTFVAMRRLGSERFEGQFTQRSTPIKTTAGAERVPLFTLR